MVEYAGSGLVPRFPTAFLAASLMVLAGVFLLMGVLLHGQAKARRETSRLFYLRQTAPPWSGWDGPDHAGSRAADRHGRDR